LSPEVLGRCLRQFKTKSRSGEQSVTFYGTTLISGAFAIPGLSPALRPIQPSHGSFRGLKRSIMGPQVAAHNHRPPLAQRVAGVVGIQLIYSCSSLSLRIVLHAHSCPFHLHIHSHIPRPFSHSHLHVHPISPSPLVNRVASRSDIKTRNKPCFPSEALSGRSNCLKKGAAFPSRSSDKKSPKSGRKSSNELQHSSRSFGTSCLRHPGFAQKQRLSLPEGHSTLSFLSTAGTLIETARFCRLPSFALPPLRLRILFHFVIAVCIPAWDSFIAWPTPNRGTEPIAAMPTTRTVSEKRLTIKPDAATGVRDETFHSQQPRSVISSRRFHPNVARRHRPRRTH